MAQSAGNVLCLLLQLLQSVNQDYSHVSVVNSRDTGRVHCKSVIVGDRGKKRKVQQRRVKTLTRWDTATQLITTTTILNAPPCASGCHLQSDPYPNYISVGVFFLSFIHLKHILSCWKLPHKDFPCCSSEANLIFQPSRVIKSRRYFPRLHSVQWIPRC